MKKQTIYLHIGAHKTGTKSIQKFMMENAQALAKQGFFVPSRQQELLPGHHELPLSLIREYSKFWYAGWPGNIPNDSRLVWERTLMQIRASGFEKNILSSECFCDITNEFCRDVAEEMGERIRGYLDGFHVRVIVYVRPINEQLSGIYREIVKASPEKRSFRQVAERFRDDYSVHLHPSSYLDFYAKLFGKDNLTIKKYGRKAFADGNVIGDFLKTIGVQCESGEVANQAIDENSSIQAADIDIKRSFNLAGIHDGRLNREVSDILIAGGRMLTQEPDTDDFWDRLADDIREEYQSLKDNYNLDFDGEAGVADLQREPLSNGDGFQIALAALSIRYLTDVERKLDDFRKSQINASLRQYIRNASRAVVYPAGAYAEWLMNHTMLSCANIVAWADRDPRKLGREFCGVPIIFPSDIQGYEPDVVFIASPDHGTEIWKSLSSLLEGKTEIVPLC